MPGTHQFAKLLVRQPVRFVLHQQRKQNAAFHLAGGAAAAEKPSSSSSQRGDEPEAAPNAVQAPAGRWDIRSEVLQARWRIGSDRLRPDASLHHTTIIRPDTS